MIKLAIAGAGGIGEPFVRRLLGMGQTEIAGVCDADLPAAKRLAERIGCPAFDSYEALAAAVPAPAALVCAGPPHSRKRHIAQALREGRHVIAAMPPDLEPEDVRDMAAAAGPDARRLLFTNSERFHYHNIDLKRRITSGSIGDIGVIDVKRYAPLQPYGDPGVNTRDGALHRLALRDVDVLRWIAGDVCSVYAMRTAADRLEYALVTLKFRSGAIANIEACLGYPGEPASAVEYAGSKGVIRYDSRKTNALYVRKPAIAEAAPAHGGTSPSFRSPEYDELVHLLGCIQGGERPAVAAEDVLKTLNVISAAERSMHTGQPMEPERNGGAERA